jgi:nucleotide-binding universal stress UspA family protein
MKRKIKEQTVRISPKRAVTTVQVNVQTILATTDFSEASLAGVHFAVVLGQKLNATVALLHVVEPTFRLSGLESVVIARQDSELAGLAQQRLETLVKHQSGWHMPITSSVRTGKPFDEITRAASEAGIDLIVIATHGYTGAMRVLLGSTAERVVRHATCSVLTVPAGDASLRTGQGSTVNVRKILVPMDFSNLSKDALPWATFLAAKFKADIVLLHVVEKFPIDHLMGADLTGDAIAPLIKLAEGGLERAAADLATSIGLNISAVVREGKPHDEICATAQAQAVDLIVLTTHGHTGLKHVWLGSTAERVVRYAHCPVLVVRAPPPLS